MRPSEKCAQRRKNHYEEAAAALLVTTGIEVRKYRSSSSGIAVLGTNQIETPRPRGPISFAILAHEVGHHLLHSKVRLPRWVEEVEAWEFALNALDKFDLKGEERVIAHARESLAYAFAKAIRRGVNPQEIAERFPVWWDECRLTLAAWMVADV